MPDEIEWTEDDERAADIAWAKLRAREEAAKARGEGQATNQDEEAAEGEGEETQA